MTCLIDSDQVNTLNGIVIAVVYNIYGISLSDLARQTIKFGCNTVYLKLFEEAADCVKERVQENNLVLTIGTGDVYKVADEILKSNK